MKTQICYSQTNSQIETIQKFTRRLRILKEEDRFNKHHGLEKEVGLRRHPTNKLLILVR